MITLRTYTEITFSILLVFEIIFQNTKFQEIKLKNVLISRNIISYIYMHLTSILIHCNTFRGEKQLMPYSVKGSWLLEANSE